MPVGNQVVHLPLWFRAVEALFFKCTTNASLILLGAHYLQDLKMMDHEKTTTGNCNMWKMKHQIAPCHLNIIIIYSSDRTTV